MIGTAEVLIRTWGLVCPTLEPQRARQDEKEASFKVGDVVELGLSDQLRLERVFPQPRLPSFLKGGQKGGKVKLGGRVAVGCGSAV